MTNPLFTSHYLTPHTCPHTCTHEAQFPYKWSPSISFWQVLSPPQRASEEMIQCRDDTEQRERWANAMGVHELQGAPWMKWVCWDQQTAASAQKVSRQRSELLRLAGRWLTEHLTGHKIAGRRANRTDRLRSSQWGMWCQLLPIEEAVSAK